jgi:signal transduction histidine kinase
LEHVSEVYRSLQAAFFDLLQRWERKQELGPAEVLSAVRRFSRIHSEGYQIVAASYLATREELITEKVLMLERLQELTQRVLHSRNLDTLLSSSMEIIQASFGVEQVYIAIYRDNSVQSISCRPGSLLTDEIRSLIARSWDTSRSLSWDDQGVESFGIDDTTIKRSLAVPIEAHGLRCGVLVLRNLQRGFKFSEKESKLLRQFTHILAMALENSFMMDQIDRGRYELRLLAGKIIDIKEEERKRLASDIHDTIAQELSGIGYQIQYCIELSKGDPDKMGDELLSLTQNVQNTIVHCRRLMSGLRPDLIDTIGLVPALKRLVQDCHKETGIKLGCSFPDELELPGDLSICLFRVVQEALANIQKHSQTETAYIELDQQNGQVVLLVSDRGVGFDMTPNPPWIQDPNRLGLLYARERVESAGGRLTIQASPGAGCTIVARIPF